MRLLTGLLFGVALFSVSASAKYPDEAHSTKDTTTVHVVWLPDHRTVDIVCSFFGRDKPTGNILACYLSSTSTIYAVEPKSFNDDFALMILGHEFWHALGAEHPETP